MKKQAYTLIAMVVLVGSMAVAAQAQTGRGTQLIANIPFEFRVGSKTLPAGEYTVSRLNPAFSHPILQLRSRDGRANILVHMQGVIGKEQENTTLIFNRYGNQYYFSQVWVGGDNSGLEAPKSRAERAAERELAGIKARKEAVALTASK